MWCSQNLLETQRSRSGHTKLRSDKCFLHESRLSISYMLIFRRWWLSRACQPADNGTAIQWKSSLNVSRLACEFAQGLRVSCKVEVDVSSLLFALCQTFCYMTFHPLKSGQHRACRESQSGNPSLEPLRELLTITKGTPSGQRRHFLELSRC